MKFKNQLIGMSLSAGLILGTSASALAGGLDFLEPAKVAQKVKNIIAKQKIGGTVNVVNAEVFDGLSAAIKYKIQSEPSYVDGYYTRLDQYTIDLNANPGDLINGNDLPLGFSIDNTSEIIFARQFKKQSESLTALPYGPKNLPLSAHEAIKNLNPGDFVALTGNLSLVLSLNASAPLAGVGAATGSTHVYISGEFLIHTFRMPNNKLRLKLIAIRGKGLGANAGLSFDNFKIVGLKVVDNKIKSLINVDPLTLGASKDSNALFMLDYVFDLDNPQAAQAYDDLVHKKMRVKDLAFVSPVGNSQELKDSVLTDLSEVEDIVAEDHNLPAEQRRVDRIFKGSNDSISTDSSFKFGLNVLRFEAGSTYAQNKVVHVDRDEKEQKYILDTFQSSKKLKVIFGLFGDESTISTNMLFSSDDQWGIHDFVAMTLGREIKMKNVSKHDFQQIQEHVKSVIPASEYAKIDWKHWDFSRAARVNGYFKNEIFFHPDTINALPKLDYQMAYTRLYNFIKASGYPKVAPHETSPYGDADQEVGLDRWDRDIRYIASQLAVIFNTQEKAEVRYNSFKNLKDFPLWQEYAGGFLVSLIPADRRATLMSYEMTFSAKGVDTISFRFGNFQQEELYKSLMYIQRVITDRSFDLRLYTDENGEFKVH